MTTKKKLKCCGNYNISNIFKKKKIEEFAEFDKEDTFGEDGK